MNEPDVSGLLCIGMHEMDMGQESYATECLKMNKDTSAMHADHGNTSTFLEEQHLSGIQPLEELRFCNTQHSEHQSQGMLANSEDESMPSSPDTSSTSNHDSPGYMEHLQDIYKAFDQLVDKDGPVMLSPEYIMCDETLHLGPHLTFSSDGIKIEYMDLDSDKMITFGWGLSNIISISCKWAQSIGSAQLSFLAESEAENGNSGPVKVQFSLLDPQWPRKQQEIWHLEARYQEIWEDIPSDVFELENWSTESSLFFPRQYFSSTDDFEEVIYPKGDPDAVSISKRDAELLLPETFVNDTIIDFYIKYLTTRIEPTEKCRYHFFNSFFFRKLADLDKDQGRAPDGRAAFLRVRKWTRKINIFEKDFVFIPVNFSLHWSLIVICYPGEMATLGDGSATLSAKLPCILHMDSLKGSHSGLKDIIQSYLSEEWKERHPESATDNSDKFLNLRFFSLELPQQDNSFDCGLFLLHYVELFLMDAPRNFNPLESDVFSGFLGHDWFHPAEASHKRSVIQKLINELVTGSFQDHPKLACSNEPPDERHQSRNAEGEPAGVSITQRCSADRTELVSTIGDDADGAQLSTSICLNDSKSKVISASGGMADTEMVSMDAVNNIQESVVCLPENDTVICLSSQDEKNETLLHVRSCVTEDDEIPKGSYMEHSESFLLTLNDNIKYSSHTEVKVQGIMTTNSCSISYNSEEVVTHQEYSLQKNTDEVGHECHMPSQDVDSLVMLDSSKGDIGPNLERMTDEDDARDLGENMVSDTQGDINKDVSELKREDRLADHKTVENAFKDRVKETDTNPGNINHGEQCVSFELTERNADNDMACDISQLNVRNTEKGVMCDDVISSGLSKGNKNQIMERIFTYKTNINTDGMEELLATSGAIHAEDAIAGAVPCEDRTCSEAQYGTVPHEGDTSCADAEMTVPENTTKRPLLDGFCAEEKDIVVSDYKFAKKDDGQGTVSCEETTCSKAQDGAVAREGDISCTDAEAPLVERACHINNETVPENTAFGAERSLLDGICDSEEKDIVVSGDKCTQKDDSQAKRSLPGVVSCEETTCSKAQDGAVSREGDTSCMDAEMPLLERACHINNKTVTENSTSDAERPLLDGFCGSEEKDIVVSDDKCAKKDDSQGTVAKRPLPGAVPCEDTTCSEAQDGTVSREGGTSCIDAEMPLVERSCHINNETVPENTTFDAKKSLIDGICDSEAKNIIVVSYEKCTQKADSQERHGTVAKRPPPDMICDNDIVFSGDKCTKKDDVQDTDAGRPRPDSLSEENVVSESCIEKDSSRGTDAKIERYYKRRKVLALERSSSGVSS